MKPSRITEYLQQYLSDVISENLANLQTVRGEVIANVVHGNMSIEEGMADYNNRAKPYVDAILGDLNAQ